MTTIAGAYSYWYFYGRDEEKKSGVRLAFLKSFWRVIRYHIGSMAFGSMIVALVQLARIILAYVVPRPPARVPRCGDPHREVERASARAG